MEPAPSRVAWSLGLARNNFIGTGVEGGICHAVRRDRKGWGPLPCNTAAIGEGPDLTVSGLGPLSIETMCQVRMPCIWRNLVFFKFA